jgi:hypothetical protein
VGKTRRQILGWESKWATPVASATFLAVVLLFASGLLSQVSGEGEAATLRSVNAHSASVTLTGSLQAVGFLLLMVPLIYLFRVVQARSPRVRNQLIGLVIVAPLFLAVSSGLSVGARHEAATQFVNGEAKSSLTPKAANEKCVSERKEKGAKAFGEDFEPEAGGTALSACEERKVEDEEAENATGEASLTPISSGLGLAGGLGFAVALFYSGLWAMRTGVLSRFWASVGMAAGVAFLLGPLFFVTLAWLLYFGLLVIGAIPGGRPPAWAAGEAVPWPTPGQKAAAELEPSDPDIIDVEPLEAPEPPEPSNGSGRRKRKQRD